MASCQAVRVGRCLIRLMWPPSSSDRSNSTTGGPRRPAMAAAFMPAGPPPTTTTLRAASPFTAGSGPPPLGLASRHRVDHAVDVALLEVAQDALVGAHARVGFVPAALAGFDDDFGVGDVGSGHAHHVGQPLATIRAAMSMWRIRPTMKTLARSPTTALALRANGIMKPSSTAMVAMAMWRLR